MLYDPKWEQRTKADPFALESLIAWLEKQPAEKVYCYFKNGQCLLAQYFTALGHRQVNVGGFEISYDGCKYAPLPDAFQSIPVVHPHTFGAALARARALSQTKGLGTT